MFIRKPKNAPRDSTPHSVAAVAALQAVVAILMTTTLLPSILGHSAGLTPEEISWLLFATLVSAAVIAAMQPFRIHRFGSGLVMLGGASPAFVGVSSFALVSGGVPLLAMLTLCSLPAVLAFARYAHLFRKVLRPAVMGTIIMLVASSLAQVVWRIVQQPTPPNVASWTTPVLFSVTFLSILLLVSFSGPRLRFWAPIIGLGSGLAGAAIVGAIPNIDPNSAIWFGVPEHDGLPTPSATPFPMFLALLPSFLILQIVVSMESYSCSRLAKSLYFQDRDGLDQRTNQGSVLANGLGTLVAGVLGALPTTTYSSSVSIVGMTGVTSRRVGFWAAAILAVIALSPFLLLLIESIPPPVTAGYLLFVVVLMFNNGIKIATENGLDMQEGILVLSGFWIGLTLQAGVFNNQFGEIGPVMQTSGAAIGGLVTLFLIGFQQLRFRGKVQSSFAPFDGGFREIQSAVTRFSNGVTADSATSHRLLLACEEAAHVMAALSGARRGDGLSERILLTLRDAGKTCAVELISLPLEMGLDELRERADRLPYGETDEELIELAGLRILRTIAANVTHSRYQDVDILSFSVTMVTQS